MISFGVLVVLVIGAFAEEDVIQRSDYLVSPEYLDKLLEEKRYADFEYYMGIDIPNLSRPSEEESTKDPRFNVDLLEGDIMLKSWQKEQARQGIHPISRWRGDPAQVPYAISSRFPIRDRQSVLSLIDNWNSQIECIKFVPHSRQSDYVFIFRGNGCYSYVGRIGGQQALSLGRGCVKSGIILHQLEHAIGFSHEHSRYDRDEYVEVLWENIPERWQKKYEKNDPSRFGVQSTYDYYSIMHYPMQAPETGKPAFRILKPGIDESRIGGSENLTSTDIEKIGILYCDDMREGL